MCHGLHSVLTCTGQLGFIEGGVHRDVVWAMEKIAWWERLKGLIKERTMMPTLRNVRRCVLFEQHSTRVQPERLECSEVHLITFESVRKIYASVCYL